MNAPRHNECSLPFEPQKRDMGRSASSFKGSVHKCDRMQSLQCLRWQVVQSAGDVSDSAFIPIAPFVPCFVSFAFPRTVPQYKSQRMQSAFFLRCSVCLISLRRMSCCRPTRRRRYCGENKAELRRRTTFDAYSLLLPPFHFTFAILPSIPPLIHFSFSFITVFFSLSFMLNALMCPLDSLQQLKQMKQGTEKWGPSWRKSLSAMFPGCSCRGVLWELTSYSIWYLCVRLIESIGGPWETSEGGKS